MSARCACKLVLGLAPGLLAVHDGLAQPYVGLGVANLSLSSEYPSIDGRSGTGFTLIGGYEFAPTWSMELSVSATDIDTGPTLNIYYPADRAEYSILGFSVRKSFWTFAERRWAPWLSAGTAYHYLNWDTFYYQLDGTGFFLGGGVDVELVKPVLLRIQASWHRFSLRDTYGDGPFSSRSRELSASAIYAFR
jgi:opacity protein-like surface antigen